MKSTDVEVTFLRSLMLAVSASALVLASAEEAQWPAVMTPFVAVTTYFVVDRRKWIRLPIPVANVLGVIAFAVAISEFRGSTLLGKLLSGVHLLVYMTWIVLLLRKGIRQFWWLLGLCVLQLAVASVLTTQPSFGAALIGMLLLLLWVLAVFSLFRAQLRTVQGASDIEDTLNVVETVDTGSILVGNGLQIDADEKWIGWRIRGIVGFAWIASLVIGIVAFLVFPRVRISQDSLMNLEAVSGGLLHQTGFTKTVELGEIGEIIQNKARVFQFEIERMDTAEPVSVDVFANEMKMDEILFRGHTLAQYSDGKWDAEGVGMYEHHDQSVSFRMRRRSGDAQFRLRITQDAPVGATAFAPLPLINAYHTGRTPVQHGRTGRADHCRRKIISHSLEHRFKDSQNQKEPVTYEVWCRIPDAPGAIEDARPVVPGGEMLQSLIRGLMESSDPREPAFQGWRSLVSRAVLIHDWFITPNLRSSLPQLTQIAATVCSSDGKRVSDKECCQRVVRYLSSSENFKYSLMANVSDPELDPIEDFLVNRRTGHCEYFASACALMLQSVGIPARVVNGYKGCEENSVSGRWEVKQYHGHTWAEAWVDGNWTTLDPTPVSAREESITTQRSKLDWIADLRLSVHDTWYWLINMMSQERQEALVRPVIAKLKQKVAEIREQGVWQSLKSFVIDFFRNPGQWFSLTGWIVTFVVLLLGGLLIRSGFFRRIREMLRDAVAWFRHDERQQRSVVRFYETFRTLCVTHGLKLPDQRTAQENASAALAHFSDRFESVDDRKLPFRIAATFNSVRFGGDVLSEDGIAAIRQDVQRFGELLTKSDPG